MVKEEADADDEPPDLSVKVEDGAEDRKPPKHKWAVPVTTGAYEKVPPDSRRNGSSHGQPVTTGASTRDVVFIPPGSDATLGDGQSSTSKSVNSEEEVHEGLHKLGNDSGSLDLPLESGSHSRGMSGSAERQPPPPPSQSNARRRGYKRRSRKHTSIEEDEHRRQRRLEKNRVTAAVSRERKRVQFTELQLRVVELEEENEKLRTELKDKSRQLTSANKELASLTKGASRLGPAQPAFESAVGAVDAMGHPDLVDMSNSLQPEAHLLPLNDQYQLLDGRRRILDSEPCHGNWRETVSASMPNSTSYEADRSESVLQERKSYTPPLGGRQDQTFHQGQLWGFPPDLQHQARLEVDFGGPIVSLERPSVASSLNFPERGYPGRLESLQSHADFDTRRMLQKHPPPTQDDSDAEDLGDEAFKLDE